MRLRHRLKVRRLHLRTAPASPLSGEDISFSSTSSDDGTLMQLQWEFDDGGSADGANVNHTYGTPGVYTVQLTVTDDEGLSNTAQETITVAEPRAVRRLPLGPGLAPGRRDRVLQLGRERSGGPDRGREVGPRRRWRVRRPHRLERLAVVLGRRDLHDLAAGGGQGWRHATISRTVDVIDPPNQNPNANFTFSPSAPQILDTVTFDSTSTDTDGSIATMEWDFDNDGFTTTPRATSPRGCSSSPAPTRSVCCVTDNEGGTDTVAQERDREHCAKRRAGRRIPLRSFVAEDEPAGDLHVRRNGRWQRCAGGMGLRERRHL